MGPTGKPGASLRVWRDYFPNALIVGADIDRDVLFQEDRIRTFYVDQTDPKAIALLWDEVGLDNFDLMIDDGLHTFDAGKCLFENSVSKLAPHGIYIIEDVDLADLRKYAEHFARSGFAADYLTWHRPESDRRDYNLVVIRRK
jgi:hypothetical protein